VYENVAFPLREKTSFNENQIRDKVRTELEHMGLAGEERKFPAELSGGMKKRVSLARAMITQPSIMLFDEPTTGLDPVIGQSILDHIKRSHERFEFTGIIVTHDVPRIFSVVNNVAMLHEGRVIVNGTLQEVHEMNNSVFEQFISGDIEGPVRYV
jgi:phospholipid/cholesterol/gamma-HCH transport system ATP-binding protein